MGERCSSMFAQLVRQGAHVGSRRSAASPLALRSAQVRSRCCVPSPLALRSAQVRSRRSVSFPLARCGARVGRGEATATSCVSASPLRVAATPERHPFSICSIVGTPTNGSRARARVAASVGTACRDGAVAAVTDEDDDAPGSCAVESASSRSVRSVLQPPPARGTSAPHTTSSAPLATSMPAAPLTLVTPSTRATPPSGVSPASEATPWRRSWSTSSAAAAADRAASEPPAQSSGAA